MRGSIKGQVNQIIDQLKEFGESKCDAKKEVRAEFEKETGEKADWHDIGQKIGIYSIATADKVRDVGISMFNFIKSEYGVRDITKTQPDMVAKWLNTRIDAGLKESSIMAYCSHAEKISVGIERWTGQTCDWSSAISEVREMAHEVCEARDSDRAYTDPAAAIEALPEKFQLAAELQNDCGLRISELKEIYVHSDGELWTIGKGGSAREIPNMTPELRERVLSEISENGPIFNTDTEKNRYSEALKAACAETGQEYHGSHGLRHNFAINEYTACIEKGMDHKEACLAVSEMLGHRRPDVVEKYYLR